MAIRDTSADLVKLIDAQLEQPNGNGEERELGDWSALYGDEDDHDPLLAQIASARKRMLAAEARMRLLVAYGREFTRPRPYKLEDLARAAGMSVSGVRTAYSDDVVARVAELIGTGIPSISSADLDLIVDRIMSDVAPGGFAVPPGYAHLPLALIDAVFSIRSHYSAVERAVAAYCTATGTTCDPLAARANLEFSEHGVDDLLRKVGALSGIDLADQFFGGNRSRSAGHLKADLCTTVASRLQAVSVTSIEDLRQRAGNAEIRRAWTGVNGLGWVTWQYFCSLVGIDHLKPDVMLMRFVSQTLNRNVGPAETDAMLSNAFEVLLPSHKGLTKRGMDHAIWQFQREMRP